MTMEYRITVGEDLIRIDCAGKPQHSGVHELLRELAQIARQTNGKRFLFDIREAEYNHAYAETIEYTETVRSLGLKGDRAALLGDKKDKTMLKYIEDVAVNRGFKVRAFTDERAAIRWLKA